MHDVSSGMRTSRDETSLYALKRLDSAPATGQANTTYLTKAALACSQARAAGAVIVGRINTTGPAFSGLGIYPPCRTLRNPWDRSSGGRIRGGQT